MIPLLDAARMRALDRHSIEKVGLPGALLMENAGRAVAEKILSEFGAVLGPKGVFFLCGRGNNGGDGFCAARRVMNAGFHVKVALVGERGRVGGDALLHLNAFLNSGGSVIENPVPERDIFAGCCVIVDALLGTGLSGDLSSEAAGWVNLVNSSGLPVVSVDIPTGISSDTGRVMGAAVGADFTVTFGHPKKGHYLSPGSALCGELSVADIGIPSGAWRGVDPDLFILETEDLRGLFHRESASHKGDFGHVLVVGGSTGKMGAAGLAAFAALRSGAGLVTAAFPAGAAAEARFIMEVMTAPAGGGGSWNEACLKGLERLVKNFDSLIIGPGMGDGTEAARFLGGLLDLCHAIPCVIDADGLNLLAADSSLAKKLPARLVITPHPGEAARLLGVSVRQIQGDRERAAGELAKKYSCAAILKGASTLAAAKGRQTVLVHRGNPGMATAGSGDVLAGIAGAFLARGLEPFDAASAAALVHAQAGDHAALKVGMESLIASDIIDALPNVFSELERNEDEERR